MAKKTNTKKKSQTSTKRQSSNQDKVKHLMGQICKLPFQERYLEIVKHKKISMFLNKNESKTFEAEKEKVKRHLEMKFWDESETDVNNPIPLSSEQQQSQCEWYIFLYQHTHIEQKENVKPKFITYLTSYFEQNLQNPDQDILQFALNELSLWLAHVDDAQPYLHHLTETLMLLNDDSQRRNFFHSFNPYVERCSDTRININFYLSWLESCMNAPEDFMSPEIIWTNLIELIMFFSKSDNKKLSEVFLRWSDTIGLSPTLTEKKPGPLLKISQLIRIVNLASLFSVSPDKGHAAYIQETLEAFFQIHKYMEDEKDSNGEHAENYDAIIKATFALIKPIIDKIYQQIELTLSKLKNPWKKLSLLLLLEYFMTDDSEEKKSDIKLKIKQEFQHFNFTNFLDSADEKSASDLCKDIILIYFQLLKPRKRLEFSLRLIKTATPEKENRKPLIMFTASIYDTLALIPLEECFESKLYEKIRLTITKHMETVNADRMIGSFFRLVFLSYLYAYFSTQENFNGEQPEIFIQFEELKNQLTQCGSHAKLIKKSALMENNSFINLGKISDLYETIVPLLITSFRFLTAIATSHTQSKRFPTTPANAQWLIKEMTEISKAHSLLETDHGKDIVHLTQLKKRCKQWLREINLNNNPRLMLTSPHTQMIQNPQTSDALLNNLHGILNDALNEYQHASFYGKQILQPVIFSASKIYADMNMKIFHRWSGMDLVYDVSYLDAAINGYCIAAQYSTEEQYNEIKPKFDMACEQMKSRWPAHWRQYEKQVQQIMASQTESETTYQHDDSESATSEASCSYGCL